MKINTEEILSRELSRKEFLSYVAAAILAATGIYSFLKSFKFPTKSTQPLFGYGGGDYGNKSLAQDHKQKLL